MADTACNVKGLPLIDSIVSATGLPLESVRSELLEIASKSNTELDSLTLDDVRALLAEYMQEVLVQALKDYSR